MVLRDIKRRMITKGNSAFIIDLYVLVGFPRLLTSWSLEDRSINYMVLTKYDVDLELMFRAQYRSFKLQTVINIGLQMLDILEKLHMMGYIHNDLKPQNILTNYG